MTEPSLPIYHYTCLDRSAQIGQNGLLVAGAYGFVWLTNMDWPVPKALGLTRSILDCDRTEVRYRVTDARYVEPWVDIRKELPAGFVDMLELAEGAMPAHWYVSRVPVPASIAPYERK